MKKELRLDREKCSLCGICQGSCPAGSIRINFQTIQAKFTLNQSFCLPGCNICVKVCTEKALQFDKNLVFYGSEKEWVVKCCRCCECRKTLPRLGERLCSACKRVRAVIKYRIV